MFKLLVLASILLVATVVALTDEETILASRREACHEIVMGPDTILNLSKNVRKVCDMDGVKGCHFITLLLKGSVSVALRNIENKVCVGTVAMSDRVLQEKCKIIRKVPECVEKEQTWVSELSEEGMKVAKEYTVQFGALIDNIAKGFSCSKSSYHNVQTCRSCVSRLRFFETAEIQQNSTLRQQKISELYKNFEENVKLLYHEGKPCRSTNCYHVAHMMLQYGKHQLGGLYRSESSEQFCHRINNVEGSFDLANLMSGEEEKKILVVPAEASFTVGIESLKQQYCI